MGFVEYQKGKCMETGRKNTMAELSDGYVRREREQWEREMLAPDAMHVLDSKGREYPLPLCPLRTEFIRDRDRILHCKSFRRLKHKTQVFLSPQGDHFRTRMTHTLEVAQIARTISRALRLNEDLTEAMALGHDLGHTPFGHAGETVLNELVKGGFEHNQQSLRLVEKLENDGRGLNLTYEVRDGIVNHKKSGTPHTLEGSVLSFSDRIAYINHDIDDAIRAGVLRQDELPVSTRSLFGETQGERINSMILDVVGHSMESRRIGFSDEAAAEFDTLRDFMFEHVYFNPVAKHEEGKGKHVVSELFRYYSAHLTELPEDFRCFLDEDGADRVVADYIAGMTDNYAIAEFERLFVPKEWALTR